MMSASLSDLGSWFWSEEFWLPPNVSWADINPDTTTNKDGEEKRLTDAASTESNEGKEQVQQKG